MDKIYLLKKIEQIKFFKKIFTEFVIISNKNDLGQWFYINDSEKLILVKIIDNISDIDIKRYNCLTEKFNIFFIEKKDKKVYYIEDKFLKKDVKGRLKINKESFFDHYLLTMPCIDFKTGTEEFLTDLEGCYLLKEYNPLQVKIAMIKGKPYILYAECKMPDKNAQYSITDKLIVDDLFLFHFVLENKEQGVQETNVVRTEVTYSKIQRKKDRFVINKNEYQKIQTSKKR